MLFARCYRITSAVEMLSLLLVQEKVSDAAVHEAEAREREGLAMGRLRRAMEVRVRTRRSTPSMRESLVSRKG